jgi:hypothetical protein
MQGCRLISVRSAFIATIITPVNLCNLTIQYKTIVPYILYKYCTVLYLLSISTRTRRSTEQIHTISGQYFVFSAYPRPGAQASRPPPPSIVHITPFRVRFTRAVAGDASGVRHCACQVTCCHRKNRYNEPFAFDLRTSSSSFLEGAEPSWMRGIPVRQALTRALP